MRCKLWVHRVAGSQQGAGAGQVRHVGVVFVGEHRVVRQPHFLRAFDLSVPVGPFDQAAHQLDAVLACQRNDVLYQIQAARLVSLHRQTKALPLWVVRSNFFYQRFQYVQRQLQPVYFFSING